jgi:transglutaminase superfamily protein
MSTVTRFARLSSSERALFLHTALLVLAIRVGLLVLPVRAVRRRLVIRTDDKSAALNHSVERIVWAVTAASRYVPGATCLTQALAAQRLLGRSGHHASIQIGVTKDDQLGFQAHAWVICGTQVVIGGPDVNRYTVLHTWKEGQ